MSLKTTLNYSPNFDSLKRLSKDIKFIIFHYTGMREESDALNRLTNIQSQVSCHYLIKNNGEIIKLVPDLYKAWHAGKSSWGKYKSLNKNSIGIEITNPGHQFNYKEFSNINNQSPEHQSTVNTSPIPSPQHNISDDYLGTLKKLNNNQEFKFVAFEECDDI